MRVKLSCDFCVFFLKKRARLSPGRGSQSTRSISRCATLESSLLSRQRICDSLVENYSWDKKNNDKIDIVLCMVQLFVEDLLRIAFRSFLGEQLIPWTDLETGQHEGYKIWCVASFVLSFPSVFFLFYIYSLIIKSTAIAGARFLVRWSHLPLCNIRVQSSESTKDVWFLSRELQLGQIK